jgi:hypothetical protein
MNDGVKGLSFVCVVAGPASNFKITYPIKAQLQSPLRRALVSPSPGFVVFEADYQFLWQPELEANERSKVVEVDELVANPNLDERLALSPRLHVLEDHRQPAPRALSMVSGLTGNSLLLRDPRSMSVRMTPR